MADVVEIVIDSLAAGGDGVARDADGRVTFVSHSAPGDRVRARIGQQRRSFARATIVELLSPGPDRVEPACALFANGACGGCQWQHLSPEAQARAKSDNVAAALRHLIDAGLELDPIETPVPPYEWRRRARLHWVRPRRAKKAIVGFYAPRSRRVTDVPRCPQLEPALAGALAYLREQLSPRLTGQGEMELVAGHDGDVHVVVHGPCAPDAVESLPGCGGIVGAALGRRTWGRPTIELEPGLPIRADWFAQPSRAGNAALLAAVDRASWPRDGARICELFSGSGNLTRVLADGAREVLAVDTHGRAGDFPASASVSFRQDPADRVAALLARKEEDFDLVVLDPPRTGAADVMAPLAALGARRVVYVSCDPATLARDARVLVEAGYRPLRAQPLELMPQTAHVEVVLGLEKAA